MFCPRVVLSFLTLYCSLDKISADAIITRNTREINWLDLEPLPHQSQNLEGDLSVGGVAENGRDSPTQIETPLASIQPSTQHQNQFQYIRGKKEKRRKVIPLDSIGRFKI